MPILTCIFSTFNWLMLISEMHFVKFHPEAGMDKVRERGAPLPGNDKENWGNPHIGIWRKKGRGRKKKEKRKKRKRRNKKRKGRKRRGERKRGEKKKEEVEIEKLTEEEEEHGDDKSSKANEWGKLGWNWNYRNEECDEKRWRKPKNRKRDRWIGSGKKRKEEWKAAAREKPRNIEEIITMV